jgi:LmbE family N-acetylglucosaminyl deacetylase
MTESARPGPPEKTRSPLTIVAIYAHPDDGEFHVAGSLAKWAAAGHRIHAVCATDGGLGSQRLDADSEKVAKERGGELARAMETIGGPPPILLGFPDGAAREHREALRERLVYWIRKLGADRVITHDPWREYEIHPDHVEVGRMASEAACFACFPLVYPYHLAEGIEPRQPAEVWYMMPTQHRPNRVVDIAPTFPTKVESLLCHASQIEMMASWFVPGADPTNLAPEQRDALRAGAATFLERLARGSAALTPGIELAEAFYALRVGPGHFETYVEMLGKPLGAPPAAVETS